MRNILVRTHEWSDVLLVHEFQYQAQQIQKQVLICLWVSEVCHHSFPLKNMLRPKFVNNHFNNTLFSSSWADLGYLTERRQLWDIRVGGRPSWVIICASSTAAPPPRLNRLHGAPAQLIKVQQICQWEEGHKLKSDLHFEANHSSDMSVVGYSCFPVGVCLT